MTKTRADLTELEGATLSVIHFTSGATAYRVRQVFRASRSTEWSGSAGAVYPAIARLEKLGLLRGSAETDKRGTRIYRLTRAGDDALERWLANAERATGAGLDPFRTRAGFWSALAPSKQRKLMRQLERRIRRERADLAREQTAADDSDRITLGLHIDLLDLRLRWLSRYLNPPANSR